MLGAMAGMCDTRFAAVEEAFAANFAAGLEVGAACAVVMGGRLVVDLSGVARDVAGIQGNLSGSAPRTVRSG
jgi:CubicO group peptidase (beta-lactamase class C family)